jgi:hypothetical protein
MFKFVLLLCLCMFSICTDAYKKAGSHIHVQQDPGAILQEIDFIYPFILFKK